MLPEMTSSSFFKSAIAARGRPQLATWSCESQSPSNVRKVRVHELVPKSECLQKCKKRQIQTIYQLNALKKYSRALGERSQWKKVEAMLACVELTCHKSSQLMK